MKLEQVNKSKKKDNKNKLKENKNSKTDKFNSRCLGKKNTNKYLPVKFNIYAHRGEKHINNIKN